MIRLQGSTVRNSGVELDDMEYVDCRFERCRMIYRGGPVPRFSGVTFVECEFVFDGAAANTFECVRMLYQLGMHAPIVALLESLNPAPAPPAPMPPAN